MHATYPIDLGNSIEEVYRVNACIALLETVGSSDRCSRRFTCARNP
jgi:hypothetical protein